MITITNSRIKEKLSPHEIESIENGKCLLRVINVSTHSDGKKFERIGILDYKTLEIIRDFWVEREQTTI